MNLKLGIVGLPNVGKSTLFNALTKSQKAAAENFPFCTIEPNVGLVNVPDQRLNKLVEIIGPEKVINSTVEFVDIAGLVEGASKGEGLGNKFLSHIRECHAIAHVLRAFDTSDIHHVSGSVDPSRDLAVIQTELILADLESVQKQIEKNQGKAKTGNKEAKANLEILDQIKACLENDQLASTLKWNEEEQELVKQLHLLTTKSYMIIANVGEDQFATFDAATFGQKIGEANADKIVPICARVEAELGELDNEEAALYLNELGADRSGLEALIQKAFNLLGLQSYFTAGPKEVRAWTIRQGDTAPKAAAAIHTDFEKGFIKADVIAYEDYVAHNGENGAKENGKLRQEGKEYLVQDGDVMHFKFNV